MSIRPAVWTTRLSTPGAGAFAALFGLEALGRALVTAALPLQSLRLMGSDEGVSLLFLIGSVSALSMAFIGPRVVERLGRARLCSLAILLIVSAALLFSLRELPTQVLGFICRACGVAALYAGLSMFIMEHIRRRALGRSEPLRMLSVGLGWTFGPLLGVQIEALWGEAAPFLASATVGLTLLGSFWLLRFRNLPIVRPAARRRGEAPFANLSAYLAQPRLLLAWLHGTGRGIFWICFVVYTPLYAHATGLGAGAGSLLVALGSGFMMLLPLWGRLVRQFGIRRISLIAFPAASLGCLAAGLLADRPWIGGAMLVAAAAAMTVIDGYGNALFLRACRPTQRSAMTPIFSSHRDSADIGQAALFAVLLSLFPIQAVFVAVGLVMAGLTLLSLRINPRL